MSTVVLSLLSGLFGALFVPVTKYISDRIKKRIAWNYYRYMLDTELNLLWFALTSVFPGTSMERLLQIPMETTVWDKLWPDLHKIAPKKAQKPLGEAYIHSKIHFAHLKLGEWTGIRSIDATRARLIDAINVLGVRKHDQSEGMDGYAKKYWKRPDFDINEFIINEMRKTGFDEKDIDVIRKILLNKKQTSA